MTKRDLDTRFEEAIALAQQIPQADLPQDVQLRCYAYYKQATSGSINNGNFNNLDLRNAFKTNAWMQISHLSIDEAKEMYIEAINSLARK